MNRWDALWPVLSCVAFVGTAPPSVPTFYPQQIHLHWRQLQESKKMEPIRKPEIKYTQVRWKLVEFGFNHHLDPALTAAEQQHHVNIHWQSITHHALSYFITSDHHDADLHWQWMGELCLWEKFLNGEPCHRRDIQHWGFLQSSKIITGETICTVQEGDKVHKITLIDQLIINGEDEDGSDNDWIIPGWRRDGRIRCKKSIFFGKVKSRFRKPLPWGFNYPPPSTWRTMDASARGQLLNRQKYHSCCFLQNIDDKSCSFTSMICLTGSLIWLRGTDCTWQALSPLTMGSPSRFPSPQSPKSHHGQSSVAFL